MASLRRASAGGPWPSGILVSGCLIASSSFFPFLMIYFLNPSEFAILAPTAPLKVSGETTRGTGRAASMPLRTISNFASRVIYFGVDFFFTYPNPHPFVCSPSVAARVFPEALSKGPRENILGPSLAPPDLLAGWPWIWSTFGSCTLCSLGVASNAFPGVVGGGPWAGGRGGFWMANCRLPIANLRSGGCASAVRCIG